MSRTDLVEAAERILKPIQQFSRGWMLDRTTAEFGVSLGLRTGEEYWIVGTGRCTRRRRPRDRRRCARVHRAGCGS